MEPIPGCMGRNCLLYSTQNIVWGLQISWHGPTWQLPAVQVVCFQQTMSLSACWAACIWLPMELPPNLSASFCNRELCSQKCSFCTWAGWMPWEPHHDAAGEASRSHLLACSQGNTEKLFKYHVMAKAQVCVLGWRKHLLLYSSRSHFLGDCYSNGCCEKSAPGWWSLSKQVQGDSWLHLAELPERRPQSKCCLKENLGVRHLLVSWEIQWLL